MPDTVRTLPEILALLADNSSGAISAQDILDQTVTLAARTVGWMDITPFESGDDGTNGANHVAIPTLTRVYGREFPGNASTTRNRTYRFHIPHDIAATPTQAFFHLHWCHVIGAPN